MSEPGPEVKPGAFFAAYVSKDAEVEEVRAELMHKTGLGITFFFRVGPAVQSSRTQYEVPIVPLDDDLELGEFQGELLLDGETVAYLGQYTDPPTFN